MRLQVSFCLYIYSYRLRFYGNAHRVKTQVNTGNLDFVRVTVTSKIIYRTKRYKCNRLEDAHPNERNVPASADVQAESDPIGGATLRIAGTRA